MIIRFGLGFDSMRPEPDKTRLAKGWIDVLLETEAGLIIIDHKTTRDDPKPVVAKYSGQLLAYKQAVEAATGKTAESWIHFPLSGNMAKLVY